MKKISLVLVPIFLSIFSCEINDAGGDTIINLNDGVQLKWIGYSYNDNGYVFYKSSVPTIPSNFTVRDFNGISFVDSDEWDSEIECVEIELFQSMGYFNYRLKDNDSTYVFTKSIEEGFWGWEEE